MNNSAFIGFIKSLPHPFHSKLEFGDSMPFVRRGKGRGLKIKFTGCHNPKRKKIYMYEPEKSTRININKDK